MKFLLLTIALSLSIGLTAQEVTTTKLTGVTEYSNGYSAGTTKIDGVLTMKLYKNSGTISVKINDWDEMVYKFTKYEYILHGYFLSIPKAKVYVGGKYSFTAEVVQNLSVNNFTVTNIANGYKFIIF